MVQEMLTTLENRNVLKHNQEETRKLQIIMHVIGESQ